MTPTDPKYLPLILSKRPKQTMLFLKLTQVGIGQEKWLPRFQRPLIFGKLNQNIRTICNDIPGATRAISSGITGYYRSLNSTHNSLENFFECSVQIVDDEMNTPYCHLLYALVFSLIEVTVNEYKKPFSY